MHARTVARIALLAALTAACGGSPTSPSAAPLSGQLVSEHYMFHYSAGDTVDAVWQEAYHAWAVAQLGVTPPTITYNKYHDRAQMGALTGQGNTNAFANPGTATVYTIWPTDNHEVVHLFASAWGSPVALFSEGLAVAFQTNPPAGDFTPRWSGTPLHVLARGFKASGTLVSIASMAETSGFRSHNDNITYPESGSFVRFLVDTEGIPQMRRLYGTMGPGDALPSVRAAFLRIYGYSLDEAETRWLRFLDGA